MGRELKAPAVLGRAIALAAITVFGLAAAAPASAEERTIKGAWLLDDGAGQKARDISGYGNHGVLGASTAAEASDPRWLALPSSRYYKRYALQFDGDDFVTVPDSSTLEPASISVGAIVRATGSPGNHRYIVSKGALQCVNASYGLYTGSGGGVIFYVSNGTEFVLSPDAGTALWDGKWHAVLGTFDGTQVRLFVDGKEIGTGTPTTISLGFGFPDNDNLYIGDYRGTCASPLGFVGDIGAVAVANRAFDWSSDG